MGVLTQVIRAEAQKLVQRHQRYLNELENETVRIARRTGTRPEKDVLVPAYWSVAPGFDPYYVRNRARTIGYGVGRAVALGSYSPRPGVTYEVPKGGGQTRTVSVFQVADNAVSRHVFKRLMEKNASRLSRRCYSYRQDLTLHDAVLDVASSFNGHGRVFVAEFDLAKYFDSIDHAHLERMLNDPRFFLTDRERDILWAFVRAPVMSISDYDEGAPPSDRTVGIPQGTSVSLFLANIAAFPLDRRLERMGVDFVRFADDTLIWSDSYAELCEAVESLEDAAQAMGVALNLRKSEGISLLTPNEAPSEIRQKDAVSFIGYRLTNTSIGMREAAVARVKRHLGQIIYRNLVEDAKDGKVLRGRYSPPVDRDYVVTVWQIRRYLYGDLTEKKLRKYLNSTVPRIQYKGLMSFYPIVTDLDQLQALDGWLLHTLHTSLRTRARLLGVGPLPQPHGLSRTDLLRFRARSTGGNILDLRVPSFVRIAEVLGRAARRFGANAISNPKSKDYEYIGV